MQKFLVGFSVALLLGGTISVAQHAPKTPVPQKEHGFLQQLVGEWDYESEVNLQPGKPPLKFTGSENVRAVGQFWIMAGSNGIAFDAPFTGVMTVGFAPKSGKLTGTWIDSMHTQMFLYEGTVNEEGKVFTLLTNGPNPAKDGQFKYKDEIEIKSKDQKVFTSYIRGDDGNWTTFMTAKYRRRK